MTSVKNVFVAVVLSACLSACSTEAQLAGSAPAESVAAPSGERLTYDRFEVRPAPGGSTIVRTAGRRTFGLLGRALAPVHDLFGSWGLLHTMQAITIGIADRQPH